MEYTNVAGTIEKAMMRKHASTILGGKYCQSYTSTAGLDIAHPVICLSLPFSCDVCSIGSSDSFILADGLELLSRNSC